MKTIQTIPLDQIDLSDETFSANFSPDLQRLRSSVMKMGILQPVFLRGRNGRYQIVSGFRRIWILLDLGAPMIDARIEDQENRDDLAFFSISLHENLTGRGFNTVETALVLDKLIHRFGVDRSVVIKTFLPLLSLETNEKILNTYLSLARMEEEVKKYVVREKVSRSNIRRFSSFTPEDRTAVLSFVAPLKLGENSLREMLTLLQEISRRDQINIEDIGRLPEIQAALSHKEITSSQKTERVKKILMDLRYPRMRLLEERFDEKRKVLNLPPGSFLHPPPFFEGKGFKMEFRFDTIEGYRSLVASLSQLSEKEGFRTMVAGTEPGMDPPIVRGND